MTRRQPPRSALQRELLRLLSPPSRRLSEQPGERALPALLEVARTHAHRPAAEVRAALEDAVRSVGAQPDQAALTEFAEQIEAAENPFL
ncbi:hypothetical protein [Modestobacter sp. I12A-02662]|uniref:hypothetical protein n=1 Tax=Modestobacter sp. I12A-02662 TaxID=1730496 RepID=UPI0034DDE56C